MNRRLFLLRKLENHATPGYTDQMSKDLDIQDMREEGICPRCEEAYLYSFTTERYKNIRIDGSQEFCGYFCTNCFWTNSGVRAKKDPNRQHKPCSPLDNLENIILFQRLMKGK